MTLSISPIQENFTLGFAIDQLSDTRSTTLAQEMLPHVREAVSALPGWEVAWGPAVYQVEPGSVRTNGAYIARNMATNAYFLGLAGTDPYSVFAWLFEDLNVKDTVAFPYAGGGAISKGIHTGWQALKEAIPPSGNPGGGLSMRAWLEVQMADTQSGAELRVGGHSLGGGLTPVFAVWLKETQADWDPSGKVTAFSAWPFAGQTPGEADFAKFYNGTAGLGTVTQRVHNTLDIVPHAFAKRDLAMIPNLYKGDGNPQDSVYSPAVAKLVALLQAWIIDRSYTQQGTDMPQDSAVNPDQIQPPNTTDRETLVNFLRQAGWQHVQYYEDRFLIRPAGVSKRTGPAPAKIETLADHLMQKAAEAD